MTTGNLAWSMRKRVIDVKAYSFNVLSEPWIPVTGAQGFEELGIMEVLERAHELHGILDPSPLIQFGIYRLLVAFIMDAYDLRRRDQLEDLLEKGRFDPEVLKRYVAECGNCFDLFDDKKPFLQSPLDELLDREPKTISYLLQHLPSGSNRIHFHHLEAGTQAFSPAICARGLCTIAPFITKGGSGLAQSINGVPPWYVQAKESNLFETLALNTISDALPKGMSRDGPPAWRSQDMIYGKEVNSVSLLEGLTWQPRRIRLIPGPGGVCTYSNRESDILVRTMIFSAGLMARTTDAWTDPNVAYLITDKGCNPLRPHEGRDLWRDTGTFLLLRQGDYAGKGDKVRFERPQVVTQFRQLDEFFEHPRALKIEVYGVQTDNNMKFFSWRYESMFLPAGLLGDLRSGPNVQKALEQADQVSYNLGKALKIAYPRNGSGNDKAFAELIRNCQGRFWDNLHPEFDQLLDEISRRDQDDIDRWSGFLAGWQTALKQVAGMVLEETLDGLDANAAFLARQVAARDLFWGSFMRIFTPPVASKKKSKGKER